MVNQLFLFLFHMGGYYYGIVRRYVIFGLNELDWILIIGLERAMSDVNKLFFPTGTTDQI